jgi:RHS repeat-associated protein
MYFGGKLVKSKGVLVVTDRLGSVRASGMERMSYYPYGEEKTSTADGREKFGTYTRDNPATDYADQRYYAVGTGRFGTADPSKGSSAADPGSWNKYAYVGGDPVNFLDSHGTNRAPTYDCHWTGETWECDWDEDGGGVAGTWDEAPPEATGSPRNHCDDPVGAYQTTDVNFMKDNWNSAVRIAHATNLTPEFIMGWASLESYSSTADGLGDAATKNNNFFGLTYRSDKTPTIWKDSIVCPPGSYDGIRGPGGHSCFSADDAFFVSGMSALTSFDNKYLTPAQLAEGEYGPNDLSRIGIAIANAGFNPGSADDYGKAIASRWGRLSKYLDCVQQ